MPAIDFPAAPAVNDEYSFEGRTWRWNGTGWEVKEYPAALLAGTAANPSLYFSGDPNTGLYSPGADQVAVATNGTQRLSINANGLLSTTAATAAVASFTGPANAYIDFTDGTGIFRTQLSSNTPFIGSASNHGLILTTNNTERLRITSAGLVGIGTSSPDTVLHTYGGFPTATIERNAGTGAAASVGLTNSTNSGFLVTGSDTTFTITASSAVTAGTGLTERFRIDSSGRVGIGTTSPDTLTHISASAGATLRIESTTTALVENSIVGNIEFEANDASAQGTGIKASIGAYSDVAAGNVVSLRLHAGASTEATGTERYRISGDGQHIFGGVGGISTAERARIDSSGRLLVGTSAASVNTSIVCVANSGSTTGQGIIYLSRGQTNPTANNTLGQLIFSDNAQSPAAQINAAADASWATNSYPGRLVFSTTADGAASPTERLRITSAGVLQVADAGNISVGTTTGTKIGTATTQKLGFYNATPVVQPAAVANATDAASVITQLNALLARMRDLGLIAT